MRSWLTIFILLVAIAGYSQSIQFQTFSAGGSTPESSGSSLTSTFGQPMVLSSSAATSGPNLEAGFGPSILAFTNNFPPSIQHTNPSAIIRAGDKISATITDADGLSNTKLYYRPITAEEFDSVDLTSAGNKVYEATVQAADFDDMGIEYFFKALDNTGKRAVKMSDDGEYFQRYNDAEGAFVPPDVFRIGTKTTDYRIITIPYKLVNPGIGTQFGELGNHKKSIYRIATYAGNSQWTEFPDVNVFERGKGYWFLTAQSNEQLSLEDESTPENHQSALFQMTLNPEWNQIGNPYPVSINWSDAIAYNDNPNIGILKVYKGEYNDGDELKPYEGGFVRNNGSTPVTISIPFKGQTSSGGRLGRKQFSEDLAADQWMLRLNLNDGETSSSMAAIGMHPEASSGTDLFDDWYPPRFTNYSEITFFHPELKNGSIAKDFVPRQDKNTWSFTMDVSGDAPLDLQWSNENLGANTIELYLLDEESTQLINMRQVNSHPVRKGASYKIYYGENIRSEISPASVVAGKPYPNPWVTGRSETVKIPFALPANTGNFKVQLEIIDAQGRIASAILNESLPPGFYEIEWDGNDREKKPCAAGVYLVRLSINANKDTRNVYNRIIIK